MDQAGWAAGGGPTTALVAVFLPSVLLILVGTPLQRIRRKPGGQHFLAGLLADVPGAAVPLTWTSLQAEKSSSSAY